MGRSRHEELLGIVHAARRRLRIRQLLHGASVVALAAALLLLVASFGVDQLRVSPWAVIVFRPLATASPARRGPGRARRRPRRAGVPGGARRSAAGAGGRRPDRRRWWIGWWRTRWSAARRSTTAGASSSRPWFAPAASWPAPCWWAPPSCWWGLRSEEHTSELQSQSKLALRL